MKHGGRIDSKETWSRQEPAFFSIAPDRSVHPSRDGSQFSAALSCGASATITRAGGERSSCDYNPKERVAGCILDGPPTWSGPECLALCLGRGGPALGLFRRRVASVVTLTSIPGKLRATLSNRRASISRKAIIANTSTELLSRLQGTYPQLLQ